MADDEPKIKRRTKGDGGLYYDAKRDLWIGVEWVVGDDGKRKQRRVASKLKSEASQKLNKLRAAKLNGTLTNAGSRGTLGAWLDEWLEYKRREVRPKSYDSAELSVRRYIKPHIGDVKLDKLEAAHVRKMLTALQDGSVHSKASTRNAQKGYQTLNNALKQAVLDGRIGRNVCAAVKAPTHRPKKRGVFETEAAVHILRTAAKRDDEDRPGRPKLASRWVAAFMTGARRGELLGLEWDRVDFDRGVIDISWQLQRLKCEHGCGLTLDGKPRCGKTRSGWCPQTKLVVPPWLEKRPCHGTLYWTRPKTLAGERDVPMAPLLLESLKVHRRLDDDPNPHNLVWHHRDGRPISPEDDSESWNMLLAASGITKQSGEAVLHEARNTAATLLLESGVDVKVIQNILGHASILQTRDYQRVSLELSKSAVASAFDALLPQV